MFLVTFGNSTNQIRMIQGMPEKVRPLPRGMKTLVQNRSSYQVLVMVGTNAYTNKNHKFYNASVHAISWRGGYCATNIGEHSRWGCRINFGIGPVIFWKHGEVWNISYHLDQPPQNLDSDDKKISALLSRTEESVLVLSSKY